VARRRAVRAERLAGLLAQLSPEEQAALAAALPTIEALASARPGPPASPPNRTTAGPVARLSHETGMEHLHAWHIRSLFKQP
jgi:hypothetical protein